MVLTVLRVLTISLASTSQQSDAAAATSRIGGGDADELLLSLLRTGASVRERESAAAALADAGSHDAVASAVAILEGAPDALHIGPEQAVRHARAQSAAPSRWTR